MSPQPRPQLENVLEQFVAELGDWSTDEAEIEQMVLQSPPLSADRAKSEARAARVLARAPVAHEQRRQLSLFIVDGQHRTENIYVTMAQRKVKDQSRSAYANLLKKAYLSIYEGYSIDRLIVEPRRNALFVHACWRLGIQANQAELNFMLLDARKSGQIGSVPGVQRYVVPRERVDQYLFASELALRSLQDEAYYVAQVDLSLDQILCDPRLAARFDEIASRLAPGFASEDYRWGALCIRKAQNRSVASSLNPQFELVGRTANIRPSRLPSLAGYFWLQCEGADVYFGHTENLRTQVDRMLQIEGAGTRVIPEWLREGDFSRMELAIAPCPGLAPSRREPVKGAYVQSRQPILNVVPTIGSAA
jgi:hypothetical protein